MAIPGVTTIIRDRFYSVSRTNTPAGPRIVAIAKRSTADNTGNVSDLDIVQATTEADVILQTMGRMDISNRDKKQREAYEQAYIDLKLRMAANGL